MHLRLCLCDSTRMLDVATRVVVITHAAETCRTTNTARLVLLTLLGSEIRVRGRQGSPLITEGIVLPDHQPLVLFPGPNSEELDPEALRADGRPVSLIVPDGNWRQARNTANRVATLAEVPRVHLPPGPPSQYRLRSHKNPAYVATFEAIARALGLLEGPEVQTELERVLALQVERTLWTRGKLPAEQVTGGIPPAKTPAR